MEFDIICIHLDTNISRAKVVVSSKGKQTLKSGQILASAILFQNDVKLLWQKLEEQGANTWKIMPAPALKMKGKRRPLTTRSQGFPDTYKFYGTALDKHRQVCFRLIYAPMFMVLSGPCLPLLSSALSPSLGASPI